MTTIIRVKRHFQDDPVEAVVLECKRQKTEEAGASPSFERVLNFMGTVENKDDLVSQRTLGVSSFYQKRVQDLKSRKPEILNKIREERKNRSEDNRFKVVSCMRSTNNTDDCDGDKEDKPKDITIVDVSLEKKDRKNHEQSDTSEEKYVYDLYSANFESEDFNDINFDSVIGVEPYPEAVFDLTYRDPEDYREEYFDPDEDDSNDENNWRNSYPDLEGSDEEEIDILTCEFKKFGRDESYELSSDDGEEKYLNYGGDDDERVDYIVEEAKDLGGSSYARYKRKVIEEINNSESFDEAEEDEPY